MSKEHYIKMLEEENMALKNKLSEINSLMSSNERKILRSQKRIDSSKDFPQEYINHVKSELVSEMAQYAFESGAIKIKRKETDYFQVLEAEMHIIVDELKNHERYEDDYIKRTY